MYTPINASTGRGQAMNKKGVGRATRVRTTDGVAVRGFHSEAGHRVTRLRITGLVVMLMFFAAPIVHASVVFSDPFAGSAGDFLFRGFYLSSYAGTNLGTVTLGYSA